MVDNFARRENVQRYGLQRGLLGCGLPPVSFELGYTSDHGAFLRNAHMCGVCVRHVCG